MSSAYVDLNPVRAFICKKPEDAEFTGFSDRIKTKNARDQVKEINHIKKEQGYLTSKQKNLLAEAMEKRKDSWWLSGFKDSNSQEKLPFFQVSEDDYVSIVEWSDREIRKEGKGFIPKDLDDIFQRLQMGKEQWTEGLKNYGSIFYLIVGIIEEGSDHVIVKGKKWSIGTKANEMVFAPPSPSS